MKGEYLVRVRIKFKDENKSNIISLTKEQFLNLAKVPIVEKCEMIDSMPLSKQFNEIGVEYLTQHGTQHYLQKLLSFKNLKEVMNTYEKERVDFMKNLEADFVCTHCGKNFGNNPIKLALHIRDKHLEDKPKKS